MAVPSQSDQEASRDPALGSFVSETLGFRDAQVQLSCSAPGRSAFVCCSSARLA
jgi:hypothetical protein